MTIYQRLVTALFHRIYYDSWGRGGRSEPSTDTLSVHWLGYQMIKCPLDLWAYQEMLVERRPDWVIETGTFQGGTSLYLASIMDLIGHGQVITIDSHEFDTRPKHQRIRYLKGPSTDSDLFAAVRALVSDSERCTVILDSNHSEPHVGAELRLYSDLVSVGDYLIVEDTNVNGHPVYSDFGPGPMEAVRRFLAEDDRFAPDLTMERFLLTMNPGGYLRRMK